MNYPHLLLEIAHCPIARAVLDSQSFHCPCNNIVHSQPAVRLNEFHLPEPWNGQITSGPILFLSSNPSIGKKEQYPTWAWSDEMVIDFFTHRFGNGKKIWVKNGIYSLQQDGTYSSSMHFWSAVREIAMQLLQRKVKPGVDYALTEIVHCKSKREIGVIEAMPFCSPRYLNQVLEISGALVMVVLGSKAKVVVQEQYPLVEKQDNVIYHTDIAGKDRYMVFLPHPTVWKKWAVESSVIAIALAELQSIFHDHEPF